MDDLEGQHNDEFTLGYEWQLATSSRITVRGIYRTLRRGIEDSWSDEMNDLIIANVGYGPLSNWDPMKRDYQALELTYRVNKRKYSAAPPMSSHALTATTPGYSARITDRRFPT